MNSNTDGIEIARFRKLDCCSPVGVGIRFIAVIFEALGSSNEDTRYLGYTSNKKHFLKNVKKCRDVIV